MYLNDAQKELIDDLRSVQEKQLETQWIDRVHKELIDAKPEEYGDPDIRYCCCKCDGSNAPYKIIQEDICDSAAIYSIEPIKTDVNDDTTIGPHSWRGWKRKGIMNEDFFDDYFNSKDVDYKTKLKGFEREELISFYNL